MFLEGATLTNYSPLRPIKYSSSETQSHQMSYSLPSFCDGQCITLHCFYIVSYHWFSDSEIDICL